MRHLSDPHTSFIDALAISVFFYDQKGEGMVLFQQRREALPIGILWAGSCAVELGWQLIGSFRFLIKCRHKANLGQHLICVKHREQATIHMGQRVSCNHRLEQLSIDSESTAYFIKSKAFWGSIEVGYYSTDSHNPFTPYTIREYVLILLTHPVLKMATGLVTHLSLRRCLVCQ